MQDIQEIFNRVQDAKKKKKDLETTYKDALGTSLEYQEMKDQLKVLRDKKKRLETTIREQFASEFTQLEDIKIDIASDMELITDIAVTRMMKGESIAIKDKDDNEYEPIFKISFKKIG